MRNNPIIVQKYGGACLETPAKIRVVASSLADLHSCGHRVAGIVSARWVRPLTNLLKWPIK
jgi:aspartate kinase